jgi:hypothetical protein
MKPTLTICRLTANECYIITEDVKPHLKGLMRLYLGKGESGSDMQIPT